MVEEIARFRLDDVPVHAAAPPHDVRPADAASSALRRRDRGRARRRSAVARRTRRRSSPAGLTSRNAHRLPEPMTEEQAVLRTTLLPASSKQCGATSTPATSRIALFEIARVFLPPERRAAGGARARRRQSLEGGFARAKGVVETLYRALRDEPSFERRVEPFLHPRQGRANGGRRLGRRAASRAARRHVGRVRARPRSPARRCARAGAVRGRRHVPGREAGPGVRGRRGRARRRRWSTPSARPPASELREIRAVRRLPRATGRRGQEVGRARRGRSSRPSARSRTRTPRRCGSGSSPRWGGASAQCCVPVENRIRGRAVQTDVRAPTRK